MSGENYTDRANTATLGGAGVGAATTTWTVSGASNWPATPFYARIDGGTTDMEIVRVTSVVGTTWSVSRGASGTTGTNHNAGAEIDHVLPSQLPNDFEDHVAASTGVHGVSGAVVGSTDSQTLSNKLVQDSRFSSRFSAGPVGSASFLSTGDTVSARDGFVHNDTEDNDTRKAFRAQQDSTDRFRVDNTGNVVVSPKNPATQGVFNDGILEQDGTANFYGTVNVAGALNTTGQVNAGNHTSTGNSVTGGTHQVNGAFIGLGGVVTTDFQATGDVVVGDDLTVSDDATISGDLAVGSTASVTGRFTNAGGDVVLVVPTLGTIAAPVDNQVAISLADYVLHRRESGAWVAKSPVNGGTTAATRHRYYAKASGTQSIPNATDQRLAFGTVVQSSDDVSVVSVSSGSEYTLNRTGWWRIEAKVRLASGAAGGRFFFLANSSDITKRYDERLSESGLGQLFTVSAVGPFVTGDKVAALVNQNSGGALSTSITLGDRAVSIALEWLGEG